LKIKDLFNLKKNTAIVTGGAGHLGSTISEALAEAGADVYIVSRNESKCKELAKHLEDITGSKVRGVKLDITSLNSIKKCFNNIVQDSGKIDILVNNASFTPNGTLEGMSEKNWIKGIDGTINCVFRTMQTVIPIMRSHKHGSIINITSMYGMVSPNPEIYGNERFGNPPNYGAGKAAVIQLSRYAAIHLAKTGIRVNSLSLGPFPRPEVQKDKWFIANLEKKTPLGRIGKPHEIKGIIVFLASEASSYVTGSNIVVDGGWTAW